MIQVKRRDFLITPFLKRNNLRALYQFISTIFPITFLWIIIYQVINHPFTDLRKSIDLLFIQLMIINQIKIKCLKLFQIHFL